MCHEIHGTYTVVSGKCKKIKQRLIDMTNLHDWINSILLLAIGVIMFSQKHIIEKMKSFFDIFDIEKVKSYVKMNEETAYIIQICDDEEKNKT